MARKTDHALRDKILAFLRGHARASTSEIAAATGASIPTVLVALRELPPATWAFSGKGRRTRYALKRELRGRSDDIPLYHVDESGIATRLSTLALTTPQGTLLPLEQTGWPVPIEARDGWWAGLPYPLYDIRPQGFMGRQLARAEARALQVSDNPDEWSDDDIVYVLSRIGSNVGGNLLLGDESYLRWQQAKIEPALPHPDAGLGATYSRLADAVLTSAFVGSSAGGEFPKFTTARTLDGQMTPHVLVKFSGAGAAAAERRWADLLVCEHIAVEAMALLPGVVASRSRIIQHAGRTFLESERFDRIGLHGRSAICSLATINGAFVGALSANWIPLAERLRDLRLMAAATVAAVVHQWWFGNLIANADMHLGNLSFGVDQQFLPAPAYDMLPMHYAPLAGGEVPPRVFAPALPLPAQRDAWHVAARVAIQFWQRAATDDRISAAFRDICGANARTLETLTASV